MQLGSVHVKMDVWTRPQSPDTNLEDFCIAHFLSVKYEELWLKTRVKDGARFIPIHYLQSALVLSIPGPYQPTMHWQDVTQKVHFLVLVRRKLGRSSSKIVKLNNNNLLAWVRSHFSHNLSKSRVKHLFINSTPRLDVRKYRKSWKKKTDQRVCKDFKLLPDLEIWFCVVGDWDSHYAIVQSKLWLQKYVNVSGNTLPIIP